MLFKRKFTDSLFKRSLGTSMVVSGLILSLLATIPNNLVPESFPVWFNRQSRVAVLPAMDDTTGPIFNPNFILSDSTFRSTRDFPNASSVQKFLEEVGSPLAKYTDNNKKASDIIFEAARGINSAHSDWSGKMIKPQLNPALILTKLETEQSLLTLSNYDIYTDKERRIAKAMGYACYDLVACNDTKKGFFDQVTGAAWQLEYNFINATTNSNEPYSVGKTITTLDEKQVYLSNAATASFYKYTPHVYWGNYNVWKIIVSYGWGTSTQKWSRRQIDNLNLRNGAIPVSVSTKSNVTDISYKAVEPLLQKDFKLAEKSNEVLLLQKFLRQEGYYAQDPSGLYGMVTRQALMKYRQEKGIKVNTINETTTTKEPIKDKCVDLLSKTYKPNEISAEIKDVQQCLREKGFFSHPTNTGKYATLTRTAHQKYRQSLTKTIETNTNLITQSSNQSDPNQPKVKSVCESLYQDNWRLGQVGPAVRQLQQCLIDQKLLNSKITGRVGNLTINALRQVKKTSLPLLNIQNNNVGCAELKKKTYRIGQVSSEISSLQRCMTDAGVFKYGKITGRYGPVTHEAFQIWRKS